MQHPDPPPPTGQIIGELVGAGIHLSDDGLIQHVGGTNNHVFTASHADGRPLVVKAARHTRTRYGTAVWAAAAMTATGVPTPTVLWHNDRICVETRCAGQALAAEPIHQRPGTARPPGDAELVGAVDAGRILRLLHTVPAAGFGQLDPSGRGRYRSLREWLLSPPPLTGSAADAPDPAPLLAAVHATLRRHLPVLGDVAPRLLHGDCGGRHLIADGGRVTGVVDLESVRGGDPLTDVAAWSLTEHPDLTTAMLGGYFPHRPDPVTVWALALYRLRIAAALLTFHLRSGYPAAARLRAAQIRADLLDIAADRPRLAPLVTAASALEELP
ncbi:phosphotransferase [Nonomuraea sp. NPDC049152]|uniref:phosphotransferase family protein n=1 Tax=Nonomuraea sp. NPDC049152 TaxID=3154350 RepID=UPI003406318E